MEVCWSFLVIFDIFGEFGFSTFWGFTWPFSFLIPRRVLRTPFEASPRRIQVCSAVWAAAITLLLQCCLGRNSHIASAVLLGLQLSHCVSSAAWAAIITVLLHCCLDCSCHNAFAMLFGLQLSHCFCCAAWAATITVLL